MFGLIKKLFGKTSRYKPVDFQTVISIRFISIQALTSTFLFDFPETVEILQPNSQGSANWDFYMTVAGTGIALINAGQGKEDYDKLMDEIKQIDNRLPDAIGAFLSEFGVIEGEDYFRQIGTWTVSKIQGKSPINEKHEKLALAMGVFLGMIVLRIQKSNE